MVDLISYKVESAVDFVRSLLLSDEDLSTQAQSAIEKNTRPASLQCDTPG